MVLVALAFLHRVMDALSNGVRSVSLPLLAWGGSLAGMLIGAGSLHRVGVVLIAFGVYRIEGFNSWTFILPAVAMALSSGVFGSSFCFRGVLFRSLEDLFGSWRR